MTTVLLEGQLSLDLETENCEECGAPISRRPGARGPSPRFCGQSCRRRAWERRQRNGHLKLEPKPKRRGKRTPAPLPSHVPTARIAPLLDAWLDGKRRTLDTLAARTGLNTSTLAAIRKRKRERTSFTVADKIVSGVDPWIWHRPPQEGGLADLYGSVLYQPEEERRR
jgi:hypothetical protein